ncbi:diphosphomevalonate/mevalonate 3,5-bisphosphate decarboxylase family protein [Flavobacterium silvaticum]|uniref:Diphosphomevalonate decarboxylase n=1 Tax=Flavobacterium silvaticum TaxID=1852020 RepID=A0A972JFF2_9FLAO|nr:diphosphomevalonate decarboxylase [Flavobacterium silvaticum]NMH27146.1 diphosphomevalonate decarboxylase [Flavobacterium silvaticum]
MNNPNQFIPTPYTNSVDSGNFTWSAPSNIALVKYWGKREPQIPANPSISFTLNKCKTITTLSFERKRHGGFSFDLLFEGQPKESFKPKILKFFERIESYLPFLTDFHFTIDTRNTFPHSSGIASSASGMAALSMTLMSVERLLNPEMTDDFFYQKASFLARLGSGSACRSIKGNLVVWGEHEDIPQSSDLFGVEFPFEAHEVFQNYRDTILIVEEGQKSVSSTVGHDLMNGNPFSEARFAQARTNLTRLKQILIDGDLKSFVALVESEALSLHAVMLTSNPYYILMKPNTLAIIEKIRKFRSDTNVPICFTLDAGANVHVLYPDEYKGVIKTFIDGVLSLFCEGGKYIEDKIGNGSELLTVNS